MNDSCRIVAFGELLLRLSPPSNLRLEQAQVFEARYGGAEANTAISLAMQGDAAAFVSAVPPNRIGACALRSLRAYGVDISSVVREGQRLGIYYFEVGSSVRGNSCEYDRAWSAFSQTSHDAFDWERILDGADAFYVSGVTPALSTELSKACYEALACARRMGVTTICDLNYRGKLWSPEEAQRVMRGLLPFVDVCIANDEDAPSALGMDCVTGSLACGIDERMDYVEMARRICEEFGCRKVASVVRNVNSVEESDWMGLLFDAGSGEHAFSAVHHMHVLEGVAAGDAFSAGLIHALLHGFDQQRAIDYAIAASVLKLTIHGDANVVSAQEIEVLASSAAGGLRVER